MKLQYYFAQLADTAFGLWLTKYKKLFKEEDLDSDRLEVQGKLDKTDKDYKIVIVSNDVCKIHSTEELPSRTIKEISPHIIQTVFTEITNIQLQKFSDFVLNLPKDSHNYAEYFEQEQLKDGYSKIEAFKNVPDVNKLVKKFSNSSNSTHNKNYEPIKHGVQHLLEFTSLSCSVAPLGEIMDTSDCLE